MQRRPSDKICRVDICPGGDESGDFVSVVLAVHRRAVQRRVAVGVAIVDARLRITAVIAEKLQQIGAVFIRVKHHGIFRGQIKNRLACIVRAGSRRLVRQQKNHRLKNCATLAFVISNQKREQVF